jgi:hypothetical protein
MNIDCGVSCNVKCLFLLNGLLDNFVLPTVSQYHIYEELPFR